MSVNNVLNNINDYEEATSILYEHLPDVVVKNIIMNIVDDNLFNMLDFDSIGHEEKFSINIPHELFIKTALSHLDEVSNDLKTAILEMLEEC